MSWRLRPRRMEASGLFVAGCGLAPMAWLPDLGTRFFPVFGRYRRPSASSVVISRREADLSVRPRIQSIVRRSVHNANPLGDRGVRTRGLARKWEIASTFLVHRVYWRRKDLTRCVIG
jgi:hypothetical protein